MARSTPISTRRRGGARPRGGCSPRLGRAACRARRGCWTSGCGHGLLLDEARRRGWTVRGLEPSAAAARARPRRARPRRPRASPSRSSTAAAEGRFDAVVLADVIEHLEDPVRALRACASLLAAAARCCVVTPDPSSATARLAGRALVGLPARAHVPAPAPDAARGCCATRGARARRRRRPVAHVLVRLLAGGLGERSGAGRRGARPAAADGGRRACR